MTVNYVMKTLQGDMMTPISVFLSVSGKNKVLFESAAKHEESGRYSFIAYDPIAELIGNKESYLFRKEGEEEKREGSVFQKLRDIIPISNEPLPFSFFGGAIGYFSYDTAFYSENIGPVLSDELNMPDVHLLFYNRFIVIDHLLQKVSIVAIDLFQEGKTREEMDEYIHQIEEQLKNGTTLIEVEKSAVEFRPSIDQETFVKMVEKAKKYIECGDIFQVVLSQRFSSDFKGNPFSLYRSLRTSNPSPYMFYLEFDDYTILGTSPESLVKITDGFIKTNPIAGTKPRGKTKEDDRKLEELLLSDEKELAEHRMLVDLGRNDLGRVSKVGTVNVSKYMKIEKYKYVMHIVSEVIGEKRDDVHVVDVITSCLPAGTVSGAPKIRAMQIINELEQQKRGVYAGAIGYISINGNLDLAIAIRTMIVKDEKAYVQAGAGIVYDSIPQSEYEETLNKMKALLEVER
ncbi:MULTISPECIES: anthranilate synthase component I [Ureibacillus]|jgi:anthranilate synthase component I|uniref:Anthranilate synthase component 1 n=1 Tax=Ureibacillus thermosphaericus TaxID=51173 RepID=A0A840PUC0_URETH|nr:anthranilate synthase component I [Ureibacillus thermosphaericus]MBB5148824.1 anthranilate synthase component 1 [Ureibacillus thermosphaericus]NKZ31602.1 anthranilate synthase component I [Ureibacillus thermosphaericus]